jgi:hypothetical protein
LKIIYFFEQLWYRRFESIDKYLSFVTPKIVTKLMGLIGSGIRKKTGVQKKPFPVPDRGSKKHRIPDPDP